MFSNGAASPVTINLPGFAPQVQDDFSIPVDGSQPAKGESIIYKIPPAFWIWFFLVVGYLGVRLMMEEG